MPSLTAKEYREAKKKGKPIAQVLREKEAQEEPEPEPPAAAPSDDPGGDGAVGPPPESGPEQASLGLERSRHVREVLTKVFDVSPVGKPRQTRSDKWKERPCVMKYRRYADAIRAQAQGWDVPEQGFRLVFYVEAPKTKQERAGDPHHLKPDIDNLTKAFFDALEDEDKYIWDCRTTARWCEMGEGCIQVFTIHEIDSLKS